MPTYKLSLLDDGFGVGRNIVFDSDNASMALSVAENFKFGRQATLYEGEKALCRLERVKTGEISYIWAISPILAQREVAVSNALIVNQSCELGEVPSGDMMPPSSLAL